MKSRFYLFLAGVLLLKVIVALQLDKQPLLQPDTGLDTTAYVELAGRVIAGDLSLGPGLYFVSPLYIYFLALVYGLTNSFTAVRLVQVALGVVAVALIFLTAREWFGRRAAWLAASFAALTGVFTYYEALLLQASIDIVLTAAALWLLTLALRRENLPLYVLAGAVFGVASLNRPNIIISAGAVALLLLLLRKYRPGIAIVAGVLAGLAPVTIRNIVVAHQWSLVSSHGGINFYIGNGPGATGYFHPLPGMRPNVEGLALDARRQAERSLGRPLADAEVSSYYSGLAWRWIRQHPGDWVRLLLRKTYGVFNAAHVSIPFSYTFYAYDAGTLLRFCFVGAWLLVPAGLLGLVRAAPRPRSVPYLIWLSFVPSYTGSVVLFFITERYRMPLYVPLAIGAGAAGDLLLQQMAARRFRELVTSGMLLAGLFAAANWPLPLDDGRAEERLRMAEHLASRGEVGEAERWTSRALQTFLDPAAVHYRVGAQFVNARLATPAITHLEKANQLRPNVAQVEYTLGRALLGGGRPADAAPHIQQAIAHGIETPLARYDLALALQRSGDREGAALALRDLTLPPGTGADLWLEIGKLAGEVGSPDLAERFFRSGVRAAPRLPRAHQLLGLALLVQGRFDQAADALGEAARMDPGNADVLATLAYCEQRLGRVAQARSHVEAAIRIDPTHQVAAQVQASLDRRP